MTVLGPGDERTASVIALVASVGGFQAVRQVLAELPVDLNAAVIVLIHQAPGHVSHLAELLARTSTLPVASVEDYGELRPSVVFVAPPGRHVLVAPGLTTRLILSGDVPPSRPSADLLFTTLATAAGSRVVAVVLTGNGHDGATGATAVHAFGGTVIATDEVTSQVFSMPRATIDRDDSVDYVVALGDLPNLLTSIAGVTASVATS